MMLKRMSAECAPLLVDSGRGTAAQCFLHTNLCRTHCANESFDSLDSLTGKQQTNHLAVLRVLERNGGFSLFDATSSGAIARTMQRLLDKPLVLKTAGGQRTDLGVLAVSTTGVFPWTAVVLTDAGKRLLHEANPKI